VTAVANKLSLDEKDSLSSLAGHDGLKAFVRLLELQVGELERDVLHYTVDSVDSERILLQRKCRAEGAAKIVREAKAYLERLKAKKES
jgi:hypothetical protein